ncbi:hypothetical protein B0G77_4731 [Paraburkholderia sp. BL10I2N1]|nr:hypothetical protein B0G77_4731 [Paraburkholderia sp. BL10I2N1]
MRRENKSIISLQGFLGRLVQRSSVDQPYPAGAKS